MAKFDLKGKLKGILISIIMPIAIKLFAVMLIGAFVASIIFNLLNYAKELVQGNKTYD